jgi:transcriptional regulator with XRE-family HTH domain
MNTHAHDGASSQSLGQALRQIRTNKKWTLKDFERASGGVIKDVVLGSYERGTRSMSVSNLEIITSIYEIPTSSLFPNHNKSAGTSTRARVVIDLRKLRQISKQRASELVLLINRFTDGIIHLRKDWNGEVLSLRSSDIGYLSITSMRSQEDFLQELNESGILFELKE